MQNVYKTAKSTITKYSNWGEVFAGEFSQFLVYEKKMNMSEIRMFSNQWAELVEDNSPLRTVINGNLIGVPEDFYDFLIRRRLSSNPVKEARVIGDILGYYPLGIGDCCWYALRIEFMIKAEVSEWLMILKENMHQQFVGKTDLAIIFIQGNKISNS